MIFPNENGNDHVRVVKTGGSNGRGENHIIAEFDEGDTFLTPAKFRTYTTVDEWVKSLEQNKS
jgi:hypothetical protein